MRGLGGGILSIHSSLVCLYYSLPDIYLFTSIYSTHTNIGEENIGVLKIQNDLRRHRRVQVFFQGQILFYWGGGEEIFSSGTEIIKG